MKSAEDIALDKLVRLCKEYPNEYFPMLESYLHGRIHRRVSFFKYYYKNVSYEEIKSQYYEILWKSIKDYCPVKGKSFTGYLTIRLKELHRMVMAESVNNKTLSNRGARAYSKDYNKGIVYNTYISIDYQSNEDRFKSEYSVFMEDKKSSEMFSELELNIDFTKYCEKLSFSQREILYQYLNGKTLAEIAKSRNVTEGAICSRMKYIRRNIQEQICLLDHS